tara:strand:- start:685 stop:885 length:201 start_codon:yes stop_codon:yes gene_type:complete
MTDKITYTPEHDAGYNNALFGMARLVPAGLGERPQDAAEWLAGYDQALMETVAIPHRMTCKTKARA